MLIQCSALVLDTSYASFLYHPHCLPTRFSFSKLSTTSFLSKAHPVLACLSGLFRTKHSSVLLPVCGLFACCYLRLSARNYSLLAPAYCSQVHTRPTCQYIAALTWGLYEQLFSPLSIPFAGLPRWLHLPMFDHFVIVVHRSSSTMTFSVEQSSVSLRTGCL